MRSVKETRYRDAGIRTGIFFRDVQPTRKQLQGFLSDLLPDDDLLLPLLECISRSSFATLKDFAASGEGEAQLSGLVNELSSMYLPQVVDDIKEFLLGFLSLPKKETGTRSHVRQVLGGFSTPPVTRIRKNQGKKVLNGIQASILAAIIVASGCMYYLHNRLSIIKASKESTAETASTKKAEIDALGETSSLKPKKDKNSNQPAIDLQKQPDDPKPLPATSDDDAGASLVMAMVPMVREAIAEGSRIEFRKEEQYDDCMVLIRAYREMATHRSTVGWYKVDLCNRHVRDITTEPDEF